MQIAVDKVVGPRPGQAVTLPELSLTERVRIEKESLRKWVLVAEEWRGGAWQRQTTIDEQPSQAQALVRAGAWLQAVAEMTDSQEDRRRDGI